MKQQTASDGMPGFSKLSNSNSAEVARILLVDDESHLRHALCRLLSIPGYEVDSAGDAVSALAALRQKTFDLVVTDLQMPDMDGLQLLTAVQKHFPKVPVILMSGSPGASRAQALAAGAVAFLQKPFAFNDLLVLVARALNEQS